MTQTRMSNVRRRTLSDFWGGDNHFCFDCWHTRAAHSNKLFGQLNFRLGNQTSINDRSCRCIRIEILIPKITRILIEDTFCCCCLPMHFAYDCYGNKYAEHAKVDLSIATSFRQRNEMCVCDVCISQRSKRY